MADINNERYINEVCFMAMATLTTFNCSDRSIIVDFKVSNGGDFPKSAIYSTANNTRIFPYGSYKCYKILLIYLCFQTYKENLQKLNAMVLIKFANDTIVWPRETEWFGFYKPGQATEIQTFKETDLYRKVYNIAWLDILNFSGINNIFF